ncbi:hypothetical protein DRP43_05955, partial [candidate division TA06 bacterium]
YTDENTDIESKLSAKFEEYDELNLKIKKLNNEITKLNALKSTELKDIQANKNDIIDSYDEKISGKKKELYEIEDKLSSDKEMILKIETMRDKIESIVSARKEEEKKLSKQIAEYKEVLSEKAEQEILKEKSEIINLKNERSTIELKKQELEANIVKLQDKAQSLKNILQKGIANINKLKEVKSLLLQNIDDKKSELVKLDKEIGNQQKTNIPGDEDENGNILF